MAVTLRILQTPLVNPFDDMRYSNEDFKQFGLDLRAALRTNTAQSGLSPTQMTAYSDALDAYLTGTGGAKSNLALQKGSTADEKEAWAKVAEGVRAKEGLVRTKYAKGSPVYIQFFPNGLSEFNKPKKGDRVDLLDNLITRFGSFAVDFPGAAAEVTTLKTDYMAKFETQAEAIGSTRGGRGQRDSGRIALADLMYDAWLTIVNANRGNPDVITTFFNVSIFDKGTNSANDNKGNVLFVTRNTSEIPEPNVKITVLTLENVVVKTGFTDSTGRLTLKNLPIGQFNLRAEKEQFVANLPVFIEVLDDQDITVNITMHLA